MFGDFTGGTSVIENCALQLSPGDVVILRAKMPDLEMPEHAVTNVTKGTRYALIVGEVNKNRPLF